MLMQGAQTNLDGLVSTGSDQYGQRYILDLDVTTEHGSGVIRSAWIVRANEDVLRFVTCFVI
jgi:hypothetical protein